jgi:uncharacterized integral membrane protein
MSHLKIILGILIGLLVIVLAIQNNDTLNQTVQLRFNPVFTQEMRSGAVSLYQIVLVSFLAGVLGTGLHGMIERFRLKKRIRSLTRELQEKDQELNSLRNLPLTYDSVGAKQGEAT